MSAMDTRIVYSGIVVLMGLQLAYLVRLSNANLARLLIRGARVAESSSLYSRLNTLLRVSWLAFAVAEVWILQRAFVPALAVVAATGVLVAWALRAAAMRALGGRWTLPTVAQPGVPRCNHGIYALVRHPNWLGVIIEITCLPLIHNAYLTACAYLVFELLLLKSRVREENAALDAAERAHPPRARVVPNPPICVIGAGAAGLATARVLDQYSLPFEVLESKSSVGGLWVYDADSPCAQNTHAVSPKSVQAFPDMPMPDTFPDFPHRSQMLEYLQNYAQKHDLLRNIRFNQKVSNVSRVGELWAVETADGEVRHYRDVILASGYHNMPALPKFNGQFGGQLLHCKDYDGPSALIDKRVLVIGAGQSAVDILLDAAVAATKVYHSTRRWFIGVPRYLFGTPTEVLQEFPPPIVGILVRRLPITTMLRITAWLARTVLWLKGNRGANWGLPAYEAGGSPVLPTLGQRIYDCYAQGDIHHKPGIRRLTADGVEFEDGTHEQIDVIVCATGYVVDFPFIDRSLLNWSDGSHCPTFYRHVFHPQFDSLFAIGMVHPVGSHWPVFHRQAELVASYLMARSLGAATDFDASRKSVATNMIHDETSPSALSSGLLVNKPGYMLELTRDVDDLARAWFDSSKRRVISVGRYARLGATPESHLAPITSADGALPVMIDSISDAASGGSDAAVRSLRRGHGT